MNVEVVHGRIEEAENSAIAVNLLEGVTAPRGATGVLDAPLAGMITDLMRAGDLKGKFNEATSLPKEYLPKGPTGVGVRLPLQVLRDWNQAS